MSDETVDTPDAAARSWRGVRLLLAGAILPLLVAAALHYDMRVCEEQATGDKDKAQTALELCHDLKPTDAPFVAAGLLALFLVGPEISEFTAFGFSVKWKIQEARQDAKEAKEKTKETEARLQALQLEVRNNANAAATNTTQIIITPEAIATARASIPQKATALHDDRPAHRLLRSLPSQPTRPEPPDRTTQILEAWEQLSRTMQAMPPDLHARFRQLYQDELTIAQGIRNAVAHAQPLADASLQQALGLLTELQRVAASPN